jgi:hypothetical protein
MARTNRFIKGIADIQKDGTGQRLTYRRTVDCSTRQPFSFCSYRSVRQV